MDEALTASVLTDADGFTGPGVSGVRDRFLVDSAMTGGRCAVVQHLFAPHALAAPMHRHRNEDEFTFVLSGRIGAISDDVELTAGPGDLIVKPRGQWHTFWNPGDEPAAVLEVITPGGLEELFRRIVEIGGPEPDMLGPLAAEFGCEIDIEATRVLGRRHRLVL